MGGAIDVERCDPEVYEAVIEILEARAAAEAAEHRRRRHEARLEELKARGGH